MLLSTGGGYSLACGTDAVLLTVALYAAFRLPPLPRREARSAAAWENSASGMAGDMAAASTAKDISTTGFPLRNRRPSHTERSPGLSDGWIGRVRRQGVALTFAVVVWAAAIGAAGFARALWTAVALLVLTGAADLVSAVYRQTILQAYVPDRMRGRLQGVHTVVAVRPFWRYEAEAGGRVPT
ncbi:hypothetical protein ACFVGN_39080 [Streptomyces sp. NPDC057757]|uniref:hypothetical protein n=1 Tax=Streptomyces sp. NPDC057757 TaxID=3346241 RepID=UPI0036C39176